MINEFIKSEKIIPAALRVVDIAGIVRGASTGEGLGNKFLSHIREVDAILHVVRCFGGTEIIHVEGRSIPSAISKRSIPSWPWPTWKPFPARSKGRAHGRSGDKEATAAPKSFAGQKHISTKVSLSGNWSSLPKN